jgi:hypothetical protein
MEWERKIRSLEDYERLRVIVAFNKPRISEDYCGKLRGSYKARENDKEKFKSYLGKRIYFDLDIFKDMLHNLYAPCGYSFSNYPLEIIEDSTKDLCDVVTSPIQIQLLSSLIHEKSGDPFITKEFLRALKDSLKVRDVDSKKINISFFKNFALGKMNSIDALQMAEAVELGANIFVTRDPILRKYEKENGMLVRLPEELYLYEGVARNVPPCMFGNCQKAKSERVY